MAKDSISARVPGYIRRGMKRYADDRDTTLSKATKEAVLRHLIQAGYLTEMPEGFTPSVTRRTLETARKVYFQIWLAVGLFQLVNMVGDMVDPLFAGAVLLVVTTLWFIPHILLQSQLPEKLDPHLPWLQPLTPTDIESN